MNKINNRYVLFFKKMTLLVCLLIITDIALGKLIEFFFYKMKSGKTARITYSITKSTEDLFIFGSSRASDHYVSEILEDSLHLRSYNAGVGGQNILFDYAVLKSIQSRTKPKIIILDLNLDEFEKSEDGYSRLRVLLPYYNYSKNIQQVLNLRSPWEKLKSLSKLYRYNSYILPIIINNLTTTSDISKKGYLPLFTSLPSNYKIEYEPDKKSIELDSIKINMFRLFIKEAKSNNSLVFVFVSPILQKTYHKPPTIAIAEKICEFEKVTFSNFSQSAIFSSHPEYFRNFLHLNNFGATKYTEMVYAVINKKLTI